VPEQLTSKELIDRWLEWFIRDSWN